MKKIAVGLSGGVDSSVAAYLLSKQGWQVVGITLHLCEEDNRCCDFESLYQAKRLCDKLGIPHYTLNVKELFQKKIINYFVNAYLNGLTPNPCVYCNQIIKFGYLIEYLKTLEIDYFATGHYVSVVGFQGDLLFSRAKDKRKSQEYFLSMINPGILKSLVFPLSNNLKTEVKEIALKNNLIFQQRAESQDVCFVTKDSYSSFIKERKGQSAGACGIIKHVNGKILGKHQGIYAFTYGQRSGLGIAWKEPLYVIRLDVETNTVFVGERKYVYSDQFSVKETNWFIDPAQFDSLEVKVRYNSDAVGCKLIDYCMGETDYALVKLDKEISSVTPGQIAVFYYKDMVIGAGVILAVRDK